MKFLNRINLQSGYIIFSVFTLWLILILYTIDIGLNVRLFYNVIYFIGDACLILSPMWFLERKSRWYSVPVVWLISIYLMASAVYFKYWSNLLPLVSIFDSSNWNHFVFESAWHKINWRDVVIILVAAIYTVLSFVCKTKAPTKSSLPNKYRIIGFFGSIMMWMFAIFVDYMHMVRYTRWFNNEYATESTCNLDSYLNGRIEPSVIADSSSSFNSGLVWYLVRQFSYIRLSHNRLDLSKEQTEEIKEALSRQSATSALTDSVTACIMSDNKDKNLIFIIVESLNAEEIGHKIDERSITPILDSLINAQGTIAATFMMPQIKSGGSSDGQLIYNTGLLPVESGITVQQYDKNRYHSLAEILNKTHSAEFIVEDGNLWNHRSTTKSFGYDKLFEMNDLKTAGLYRNENGADHAIFTFALRHLKDMPLPFYAEITTLSMHYPFDDKGIAGLENGLANINTEQRYQLSLKYFDSELGLFLNNLKRLGLYDNSIIIIASDHDTEYKVNIRGKRPICFIALNTGITKHITTRTWQADVFPTILDIMGVDSTAGYRGLGHSLLSDSIPERDDDYWATVRGISDRIIRSDYFNRN